MLNYVKSNFGVIIAKKLYYFRITKRQFLNDKILSPVYLSFNNEFKFRPEQFIYPRTCI